MDRGVLNPGDFAHVRVIIGMVLGLSLARLVNGLMRFIQHPGKTKIYPVHLGWVLYVLVSIIHFWWYEFHLSLITKWTFPVYFFLILYTMIFAALSSLLFPDDISEYNGFQEYFQLRKRWFFCLLAIMSLMDIGDTLVKGNIYFRSLGGEYLFHQCVFFILPITAIFIRSIRQQLLVVVMAITYQLSWILRIYDYL